ncbi:MAG: cyclic pyranopterin monophosphate synthase MoaC [Acidobacteriia bacterium]|nr:cyclic pyranopterin monophosphate synthase MoaC [Terriglobia bacterium]
MAEITHLDEEGHARMVDVSAKPVTTRKAVAQGVLVVGGEVMTAIREGRTPKGNVYEAARLAGIMAAKRTADLIPLCHPLPLGHVAVSFHEAGDRITIRAEATADARTGVEMEALTAVAVAGLTLYDMLKALSKGMVLSDVRLLAKSGGTSGEWRAPGDGDDLEAAR